VLKFLRRRKAFKNRRHPTFTTAADAFVLRDYQVVVDKIVPLESTG
jgi:hypothetical protein